MMEYLKVAQDLETFDCLGINVYNEGDKLNPKISFPWSEINRISFKNNDFIVKLNDKKSPKFIGICRKPKVSKKIYELASGNHEMYMRRRRPDTLEVQQMKAQKKEEEAAKAKEKAELSKEVAARAKAEQMREEMEAKYKEMESRMKKRDQELEEANANIKKLEEQLQELREAKDNLESQQEELKEMMQKLEDAKNLEAEERQKNGGRNKT